MLSRKKVQDKGPENGIEGKSMLPGVSIFMEICDLDEGHGTFEVPCLTYLRDASGKSPGRIKATYSYPCIGMVKNINYPSDFRIVHRIGFEMMRFI